MQILQRFDHREEKEFDLILLESNTIVFQFFDITLNCSVVGIFRNSNKRLLFLVVVKYFDK